MSTQKELYVTEGESATVSSTNPKNNIFREKMELLKHKEDGVLLVGRVMDTPVFSHKKNAESFYNLSIEVDRDNTENKTSDILDVIVSDYIVEDVLALEGKTVLVFGELRSKYNAERRLCIHVFAESVDVVKDSFKHQNRVRLIAEVSKDTVKRTTPSKKMDITDIFLKRNVGRGVNYYFPSIAWRRNSIFAGRLHRGNEVLITGRLQSRNYVKKMVEEGEREDKRTVHEISIMSIELVSSQTKSETKEPEKENSVAATEEKSTEAVE